MHLLRGRAHIACGCGWLHALANIETEGGGESNTRRGSLMSTTSTSDIAHAVFASESERERSRMPRGSLSPPELQELRISQIIITYVTS